MSLKQSLAAIGLLFAVFVAQTALAESSPCAEDDLKCRVTQLEARLDALTNQAKTQDDKIAQVAAATPTKFHVRRSCAVSCQEEGLDECKKRGFAYGEAKDWERPRSGATTLLRISCHN